MNAKQTNNPLSPIEANDVARALRNLIMTFDKSGAKEREFLCSLSSMGGAFLRVTKK